MNIIETARRIAARGVRMHQSERTLRIGFQGSVSDVSGSPEQIAAAFESGQLDSSIPMQNIVQTLSEVSGKQSSPEMSSLAGNHMNITPAEVTKMGSADAAKIIRRLSACVLAQDEIAGQ